MNPINIIEPLATDTLSGLGLSKITTPPFGSSYPIVNSSKMILALNDRFKHEGSAAIQTGFDATSGGIIKKELAGVAKSYAIPAGGVIDFDLYFCTEYYSDNLGYHYFSFEIGKNGNCYGTTLLYNFDLEKVYLKLTNGTWYTLKTDFLLETFTHFHYFRIRIDTSLSTPKLTDIVFGGEKFAIPTECEYLNQNGSMADGFDFKLAVSASGGRIDENSRNEELYGPKDISMGELGRVHLSQLRLWNDRGVDGNLFNS